MFIRKKKVIKEIETMVEDLEYWQTVHSKDQQRVSAFQCAIEELLDMKYWLEHNERLRQYRRRAEKKQTVSPGVQK